jgi:hypothetical protein
MKLIDMGVALLKVKELQERMVIDRLLDMAIEENEAVAVEKMKIILDEYKP